MFLFVQDGQTALIIAVDFNNVEMAEMLLKAGANLSVKSKRVIVIIGIEIYLSTIIGRCSFRTVCLQLFEFFCHVLFFNCLLLFSMERLLFSCRLLGEGMLTWFNCCSIMEPMLTTVMTMFVLM